MSDNQATTEDAMKRAQENNQHILEELKRHRAIAAAAPSYRKHPSTYAARCQEWAKRDYWTLNETANLLCGTDPQRPVGLPGHAAFNAEIQDTRAMLYASDIPYTGRLNRRFRTRDVFAWIQKKGLDAPPALLEAIRPQTKSKGKPVHGNTLTNAEKHQKVLGAAIAALVKFRAQCKDRGDKVTGRRIAELLEQRGPDLFNGEAAPYSIDRMARLINEYLPAESSKVCESS